MQWVYLESWTMEATGSFTRPLEPPIAFATPCPPPPQHSYGLGQTRMEAGYMTLTKVAGQVGVGPPSILTPAEL